MQKKITANLLFDTYKSKLQLKWIAGRKGKGRVISEDIEHASYISLIGHLNAIHPNQIQVLGRWELEYLAGLGKNSYHDVIQQIFFNTPVAVIVADDIPVSNKLKQEANFTNTPLFSSPIKSQKLINQIHNITWITSLRRPP